MSISERDQTKRRTPMSQHWGTYWVEVEDGKLKGIEPYEKIPPPIISPGIVEAIDDPVRIRRPMIRKGGLRHEAGRLEAEGRAGVVSRSSRCRGMRRWTSRRESWTASAVSMATPRSTPAPTVYAGRFHHAQSQIHRFMNMIGGQSVDNYSYAAANVIARHIVGEFKTEILNRHTTWDSIAANTDLVVMFGGLPIKNAQVTSGGVGRHTLYEG